MTIINSNMPASIAHSAIRLNARAMDQAMERLSTGKRINSGADDPGAIGVAAATVAVAAAVVAAVVVAATDDDDDTTTTTTTTTTN